MSVDLPSAQDYTYCVNCYVKDFGEARLAVCEIDLDCGAHLTAQEPLTEDPTPTLWARLGALLAKSGEVVEAQ